MIDLRHYYAERTNARSPGFEITTPGPSLSRLIAQLVGIGFLVLIAAEVLL